MYPYYSGLLHRHFGNFIIYSSAVEINLKDMGKIHQYKPLKKHSKAQNMYIIYGRYCVAMTWELGKVYQTVINDCFSQNKTDIFIFIFQKLSSDWK